jgi:flagellar basal-body rod protein FlgF
MDHFLYTAATGARQIQHAQMVNAHNLANASTVGFKQDLVGAEAVYLRGGDGQHVRAYNVIGESRPDLHDGMLEQTGRDLDVAMNGQGFFAVLTAGGVESLTRRGDLRVDEFGQLVNGAGDALLGNNGPVALPPFSSLTIGVDGTISIVPLGAQPNELAVLDRIKMVNPPPDSLYKDEFGALRADSDLPLEADGSLRLVTGSLEASNVNSVTAMVRMIELSREFEQHMNLMKIGEELDSSSAALMRVQS